MTENSSRNKKIFWICFLLSLLLGAFLSLFKFGSYSLFDLYSDTERLRETILSFGTHSEIAYICFQAMQVILAPIPGELTGSLAGYIFGGAKGAVLATLGLSLGSLIAFTLGRWVGKPLVNLMVSDDDFKKYSIPSSRKRMIVVFVIFLIPGFPKDVLTYIFSLSSVGYVSFFLASQLGRIPGTLLLTFGTEALFEKNWFIVGLVSTLTILMLVIAFVKKKQILTWLKTE